MVKPCKGAACGEWVNRHKEKKGNYLRFKSINNFAKRSYRNLHLQMQKSTSDLTIHSMSYLPVSCTIASAGLLLSQKLFSFLQAKRKCLC